MSQAIDKQEPIHYFPEDRIATGKDLMIHRLEINNHVNEVKSDLIKQILEVKLDLQKQINSVTIKLGSIVISGFTILGILMRYFK